LYRLSFLIKLSFNKNIDKKNINPEKLNNKLIALHISLRLYHEIVVNKIYGIQNITCWSAAPGH
jgi:hypothetical protein